ncbi:MAG: hypothetical protein WBG92_04730 [Thiohalocapsa sp.]
MRSLCCIAVLAWLLLGAVFAQGDERRQSDRDTGRHPTVDGGPDRTRGVTIQGPSAPAREPRDPAVRQYWSGKCLQQRARGWGHSGDCESPAYHGGGASRGAGWYPGGRYPRHRGW